MKLSILLLFATCFAAFAETEERVSKRFAIQPGGTVVVDVDFGSIELGTNGTGEVMVDVVRKVTRPTKSDEEKFLSERPVTMTSEADSVTIRSRAKAGIRWSSSGRQRTEARYTISVPALFKARLATAGGAIAVSDLDGEVKASTSGGGLQFARLHGPLDGYTSGGAIRVADCQGPQRVKTSGGGIDVAGGSGSFTGDTSGGTVSVKGFRGPVQVKSSGGGITIENVIGKVEGKTSGGTISARFLSGPADPVTLETSGGGVTLRVPEDSAFDLDASTSGGSVSSDLPVSTSGKPSRQHLKGPVNGGGKPIVLRTSGGNVSVRKL